MCLQFGFVIFWRKDLGTKAAHKMLMKLTPGGSICQGLVFQLFVEKPHSYVNNSTTTKAREKVSIHLESLIFYKYFYQCLTKFHDNHIFPHKFGHKFPV